MTTTLLVHWPYRFTGHTGSLAIQVHWPYRFTGHTGSLAIQVHWPYRFTGHTGSLAIQVHWPYRFTGHTGSLAIQVHWPYRFTGHTGSLASSQVHALLVRQTHHHQTMNNGCYAGCTMHYISLPVWVQRAQLAHRCQTKW